MKPLRILITWASFQDPLESNNDVELTKRRNQLKYESINKIDISEKDFFY